MILPNKTCIKKMREIKDMLKKCNFLYTQVSILKNYSIIQNENIKIYKYKFNNLDKIAVFADKKFFLIIKLNIKNNPGIKYLFEEMGVKFINYDYKEVEFNKLSTENKLGIIEFVDFRNEFFLK